MKREYMGFCTDDTKGELGTNWWCNNCGAKVGDGLLPKIKHYSECEGKGMIELYTEHYETHGSITLKDIEAINDFLNRSAVESPERREGDETSPKH